MNIQEKITKGLELFKRHSGEEKPEVIRISQKSFKELIGAKKGLKIEVLKRMDSSKNFQDEIIFSKDFTNLTFSELYHFNKTTNARKEDLLAGKFSSIIKL